jgi:protein-S-isoprenylcysteine O-methyltransferase Ste14
MYVGVLMVIGGQALLFESWLLAGYAAGVGMAFHLFVVRYEEPRLRELFGADYDRYRTRVGRWLPR